MNKIIGYALGLGLALYSCKPANTMQQKAQSYLDRYNAKYRELYTSSNEGQWKVNTHMVKGDSSNAIASGKADEAMAAFTGSKANIDSSQYFLKYEKELTDLQLKQLKKILFLAGNNPETLKDKVKARIKAETAQTEALYSFNYTIDGKKVSTNDIDSILGAEKDLNKRKKAWEASKEVGKTLIGGLEKLQKLRNETVQGLGYHDFFSYQVSEYGMTTDEMMELNHKFIAEVWPLYRELHTYARYELAKKYHVKEVPDMIPAHWLGNRWGQDWSSMIEVKGLNVDSILGKKSAEWIVKKGEEFYVSMGFDPLPKSFWEKSSLYPVAKDAGYSKNNHASAWHIDLDKDVRSLMSVVPNSEWYETVNHELGHIYYYLSYSNKDVPYLEREGANRAYHEAFGTMIGMDAMQKPFLAKNGLLPENAKSDDMMQLLQQAMKYIVFIPFSSGVMTGFEHDLYANNLPRTEYNKCWWDLSMKYQGIAPPEDRTGAAMKANSNTIEQYCDAASKTHINDDPAQYYDYAISFILLFQIHDHIAKQILHQDPHAALYYGNKEVGKFLKDIMYWGGSKNWRKVLKDKTGSDLSAKAMLEYFQPLMEYLKKENQGRKYTLPEKI